MLEGRIGKLAKDLPGLDMGATSVDMDGSGEYVFEMTGVGGKG